MGAQEEMSNLAVQKGKGGLFKGGSAPVMARRYIVLTDQMPPAELSAQRARPRVYYGFDDEYMDYDGPRSGSNQQVISEDARAPPSFLKKVRDEAEQDAYTVVFGVATDTSCSEQWRQELRGIKGCNFSEVSGDTQIYSEALRREFATMVTPIATDFSMELHAAPFAARGVLGWQAPTRARMHAREGEFLRFTTLFPMLEARGGIYMLQLDSRDFGKASKNGEVGRDTTISWQYRDINGRQQHASQTIRFTKIFAEKEGKALGALDSEYTDQQMRRAMMVTRFVKFVHNTCRCQWWNQGDVRRFEHYWDNERKLMPADDGMTLEQDLKLLRKFVKQDEEGGWCPVM